MTKTLLFIAPANHTIPQVAGFESKIFNPTLVGTPTNPSPSVKADIASIKTFNADLIIIPIEQSSPYLMESFLYGGLELLVWLRLNNVNTHVVVTSLYPLQFLLKQTKLSLILSSKGVTFQQLPVHTTSAYYLDLTVEKAEKENLKSCMNSMFDIVEFRHAYANIWGLKRLVEVHKKYDTSFDETKIKYPKIEDSLTYQIAEFVFGIDLNQKLVHRNIEGFINGFPNDQGLPKGGARKKLKELNVRSNNRAANKILLIDDQAETGWEVLLKSILPPSITLEKIDIGEAETKDSLVKKFEKKYEDTEYLMVILDLRLLKSEENQHDYLELLSVKLMQDMLGKKRVDEYVYPHLKFVLFTASNQLHNMLSVLHKNEYTPHRIFIKEGFDINQTQDQLYKNYLSLLQCITDTALASHRGKPKLLESYKVEEQNKIEVFQKSIDDGTWQGELNTLYNNGLKDYSHIILDTNIFYLEKPLIALSPDANIILCYPVSKEMERHSLERGDTYVKFCAQYFLKLYENRVETKSLSTDILTIDTQFNTGASDIADNYFEQVVEYYANDPKHKVLFISNDMKGKAGNNGNLPPNKAVRMWAETNNKTNVSVATIFKGVYKQEVLNFPSPIQPIVNQPQSPKQSAATPLPKKSVIPQSGHLKVKWKDCTYVNRNTLTFLKEEKVEKIIIGEKYIPGFKDAFDTLSKTDIEMELTNNKGIYAIHGISKVKELASSLKLQNPQNPPLSTS
jgi:hypothetical protein